MADELDDDDELSEGDEPGSGGGLKKMLLFVGAPVLLLSLIHISEPTRPY